MYFYPVEAYEIFENQGGTDEIVRQKILNAIGRPAASRTARRWRGYWREGRLPTHRKNSPISLLPSTIVMDHGNSKPTPEHIPTLIRRPPAERRLLDAAVMDIETTDFGTEGYEGHLLVCSILPLREDKPTTLSIKFDDRGDDSSLLVRVYEELWKFDVLIMQNGAAFDLNWLNSRRSYYGMPTLRTWLYFDTYQVAKSLGLKTRKSLGNLGDYYGLDGTKTAVQKTSWSKVRSPYQEEFQTSLDSIIYHCEEDVKMTRNLWDVLFTEALVLGNNQFKKTKWATGVPSWSSWEREWEVLKAYSKQPV